MCAGGWWWWCRRTAREIVGRGWGTVGKLCTHDNGYAAAAAVAGESGEGGVSGELVPL